MNVLCRSSGVAKFDSARENAAANFPVLVAAFLDGFRTNAKISRITLRCSFRGGSGCGDVAGDCCAGELVDGTISGPDDLFSNDDEKSKIFSVIPHVSDGFETVIGGICNTFKPANS